MTATALQRRWDIPEKPEDYEMRGDPLAVEVVILKKTRFARVY